MPDELFKVVSSFKTLTNLKLTLSSTDISDLTELSKAISILTDLTHFQLSLGYDLYDT